MRTLPDARDIAMALEYQAGANLKEVGRRHGVTKEWVRQRLEATGVETRSRGRPKMVQHCQDPLALLHRLAAEICSTVLDDWSPVRVCKLLGLDWKRVKPLMSRRPTRRAIADARAPLASAIVLLWNAGLSLKAVAETLGTTQGVVSTSLQNRRAAGQEVRVADRREAGRRAWAKVKQRQLAKGAQP